MKFVVILILVVFLSTLFGNIGGFFSAFLNGGQILFNSLSIFITFIGKAIEPIVTKPYLSMVIYIFLFVNVFIFIIQMLVSSNSSSIEDEEDEIDTEISSHSTYYGNQEIERYTMRKTWKTTTKNGKRRRYLIDTSKDIDFKED